MSRRRSAAAFVLTLVLSGGGSAAGLSWPAPRVAPAERGRSSALASLPVGGSQAVSVPGPQPLPGQPSTPTVPPPTGPRQPNPRPAPKNARFLVALGDSVPMWNGTRSYPYLVAAHLSRHRRRLRVENLALAGESSSSMRYGGQYAAALRFLRAHRGRVSLITIDIGGIDIEPCVLQGRIGPRGPCSTQVRATIHRNLKVMLRGLRAAAPGVPIVGMTYYDPFLGEWLAGGAQRALALSTLPGLRLLNRELTTLYGARRTADVQGAFRSFDFRSVVASPWGSAPVAVVRACAWLEITCRVGAPEGFADDPNFAGAVAIAGAFDRVVDRQRLDRGRTSAAGARH